MSLQETGEKSVSIHSTANIPCQPGVAGLNPFKKGSIAIKTFCESIQTFYVTF